MNSLSQYDLSGLTFPLVTLYYDPIDYPGKWVARVFETVPQPAPTDMVIVRDKREEIIQDINDAGFQIYLTRSQMDDPKVVGVFFR